MVRSNFEEARCMIGPKTAANKVQSEEKDTNKIKITTTQETWFAGFVEQFAGNCQLTSVIGFCCPL